VTQQLFARRFIEAADLLAIPLGHLTQEMICERHNVFLPVT